MTPDPYARDLAIEGEYWDGVIAERLLMGEIPGSVDFRLFFTQLRADHDWQAPCIGDVEINFRRREMRHVIETATRVPGARVLDLGCGAGWLSLELARQGAHVTAVDISPTNRALARYAAKTNTRNFPYLYQRFLDLPIRLDQFGSVEYVHGDLNTLTLPTHAYDVVVVWDSLHHVVDIERLFDEVRLALKPKGVFVGLDHTAPTARTDTFRREVEPIIEDVYRWATEGDPPWLAVNMADLGRLRPWGLMALDPDTTPVPGALPFLENVRREMLEIVRDGLRQEMVDDAAARAAAHRTRFEPQHETPSPFEDVSAGRLTRVLLERFRAIRFETVCPIVRDQRILPEPRSEAERLFQHYLSAIIIEMGARAIARGQADGHWFLFELSAEAAPPGQAARLLDRPLDDTQTHIRNLTAMVQTLERAVHDKDVHIRNLEALLRGQR